MLRLKRASAGSGKTYELAKTYIKMLLTYKHEDDPRLLRHESTVHDALKGIMAVTFTVKATAEMKLRIVEKLSELAHADEAKTPEELKKIDYLEEFEDDLHTTRFEIARLARKALRVLLLNFSDFKVQTIDSFFQGILHTFAYEASLDDGFNMEIDTEYVATVGLDSALDDLSGATATHDPELAHWLKEVMDGNINTKKWNVFTRQNGNRYLYNQLIREAGNLEKEEYHGIHDELTAYFKDPDTLPMGAVIEKIDGMVYPKWRPMQERRLQTARLLKQRLDEAGLTPADLYNRHAKKLTDSLLPIERDDLKLPSSRVAIGKPSKKTGGEPNPLRGDVDIDPATRSAIREAYEDWMDAVNSMLDLYETDGEEFETWVHYRAMIPKLMIVMEIARRKEEYLKLTNSLQISDTNHILQEIIGGEDTPFVYERMGSRLNHYLIDEFQDTSRMQWDNLLPLLKESDSGGHDNLIIGDAKQSIYRFRNADYRLIMNVEKMDTLPSGFSKIVKYTTENEPKDKSAENTNYRSKPCVVEMNNHIFSKIISLKKTSKERSSEPLFDNSEIHDIYRDAVQAIPKRRFNDGEPEGYVEIHLTNPVEGEDKDEADNVGYVSLAEPGLRDLPATITALIERGYRPRDIGILVKSHDAGQAAMKSIREHNFRNPEASIKVISEESQLVATSLAVRLAVHALEMAVTGLKKTSNDYPKEGVPGEPITENALYDLLRSLQTLSIPSLVEAIIEKFVPANVRKEEAPFIAAFQDAAVEYSMTHTSDIGSFLKWWRQKSKKLSIVPSEESEGVRLQTIHQSKGLEYKCVIIPYGKFSFRPGNNQNEWRWVKPVGTLKDLLPPYLPVETSSHLEKTAHSEIRKRYLEEFELDELNKMYVGLTRAVNELYLYMPLSQKNPDRGAGNAVDRLLENGDLPAGTSRPGSSLIAEETDDGKRYTYGSKLSRGEIEKEKTEETEKRQKQNRETVILERYEISEAGNLPKFRTDNPLLNTGDEDPDPRAEGTLKHRVMQMVERPADLDKALKQMRAAGLITKRQAEDWKRELEDAIKSVEKYGWFEPANEVINERPLINGSDFPRPDRIEVTPDGHAIIIDYKFGQKPDPEYKKKVGEYSDILVKSGAFSKVSSYLWYVARGKVEKVT